MSSDVRRDGSGPPTGGPSHFQPSRIVVVEPHADDAYLSLHSHLHYWTRTKGIPLLIVTLCGANPKRVAEARQYAERHGAAHVALPFPDAGGIDKEWAPEQWAGAVETLRLALESDPASYPHPLPSLFDGQQPCHDPASSPQWVFPLGLQHRQHRAARALARAGDWLYVDQPYGLKSACAEELELQTAGLSVVSLRSPRRSYKASPAPGFKTQSQFFHFNPPDSGWGHTLEIVLRCA